VNRDEILQAVAKAAADYREATGELTEDLSLALALAELEPPGALGAEERRCEACSDCTRGLRHPGDHDCDCAGRWAR
jgi:hypothetical protein